MFWIWGRYFWCVFCGSSRGRCILGDMLWMDSACSSVNTRNISVAFVTNSQCRGQLVVRSEWLLSCGQESTVDNLVGCNKRTDDERMSQLWNMPSTAQNASGIRLQFVQPLFSSIVFCVVCSYIELLSATWLVEKPSHAFSWKDGKICSNKPQFVACNTFKASYY